MGRPTPLLTSTPLVRREEGMTRALVIAAAWRRIGDGVATLSNASGHPLARTVKLILDPLIIRPVQHPHLAGTVLDATSAAELARRMLDAADDLRATAAWFVALKHARRALRITDGNPQDLYFQRCFELARSAGPPGPDAAAVAARSVTEVHEAAGDRLLTRIRNVVLDEGQRARLDARLAAAWAGRPIADASAPRPEDLAAVLDACATDAADAEALFHGLVERTVGAAGAAGLDAPGAARERGLTVHDAPRTPVLGRGATKNSLPRPFDRSIFERLFAALSAGTDRGAAIDAEALIEEEIERSSQPWQLAAESSRVVLLLGWEAGAALEGAPVASTAAHRMLRRRWTREAYVRRVLRLPAEESGVPAAVRDDVRAARAGYMRRLWARLHGRELHARDVSAAEVRDTLDGVLRSVVMDQRQRLKAALGRDLPGAA